MFSEGKVTEIFHLAMSFASFLMRNKKNPYLKPQRMARNIIPQNRKSDAEIIVIFVHKTFDGSASCEEFSLGCFLGFRLRLRNDDRILSLF